MFISGSDEDSTVFMEYPQPESRIEDQLNVASKHMSFLSMDADATPLPSPAPFRTNGHRNKPMFFSSPAELLDFVTRNWRMNFVTLDLYTRRLVEMFVKRPFFMLLSVDGPLYERYRRAKRCNFFFSPVPICLNVSSIVCSVSKSLFWQMTVWFSEVAHRWRPCAISSIST